MVCSNPTLIQAGSQTSAIPLVLVHDGGGTCSQYYRLGNLLRPVYGIHNPRHQSGRPWKGGLAEMAAVYADLVRTILPSGPLLLGGWSLGGILALEIANRLSHSVAGIVMIDSVFPLRDASDSRTMIQDSPSFDQSCPLEVQRAVRRSMALSADMVDGWAEGVRHEPALLTGAYDSLANPEGERPAHRQLPVARRFAPSSMPPAILLRATDHYAPAGKESSDPAVSKVDIHRTESLLGWDRCGSSFIQAVRDVPGHHFNIFADEHIKETTRELASACRILEMAR